MHERDRYRLGFLASCLTGMCALVHALITSLQVWHNIPAKLTSQTHTHTHTQQNIP